MKYVTFALIVMALSMLGFTAWGSLDPAGFAGLPIRPDHGFTEILYAYTSGTGEQRKCVRRTFTRIRLSGT